MQVAPMRRRSVSCGNEPDPRGGQLVESLLELRREPNIGNRCGRLRGHGRQEFKISVGIVARLGAKINSPDQIAGTGQVDTGSALPGHLAGDAYRIVQPATIRVAQPYLYPTRADSVAYRMCELRQQLVEFGGLLHRRAEVLE
jgi:hypothetical protein